MAENNHKLGIKFPDASKNYCQGIQIYIDRERINNEFGLYPLDREGSRIENFDEMDLEFDVLELEVANVGEIARFMNEETFNKFCELWRKYHNANE